MAIYNLYDTLKPGLMLQTMYSKLIVYIDVVHRFPNIYTFKQDPIYL